MRLIGRCREFQGRPVSALVAERGLSEIVRIDDWLPHDQVRVEMLEADALVLFAQHQPLQVPNKLYEYLATGRPILAFVDGEVNADDSWTKWEAPRWCTKPIPLRWREFSSDS